MDKSSIDTESSSQFGRFSRNLATLRKEAASKQPTLSLDTMATRIVAYTENLPANDLVNLKQDPIAQGIHQDLQTLFKRSFHSAQHTPDTLFPEYFSAYKAFLGGLKAAIFKLAPEADQAAESPTGFRPYRICTEFLANIDGEGIHARYGAIEELCIVAGDISERAQGLTRTQILKSPAFLKEIEDFTQKIILISNTHALSMQDTLTYIVSGLKHKAGKAFDYQVALTMLSDTQSPFYQILIPQLLSEATKALENALIASEKITIGTLNAALEALADQTGFSMDMLQEQLIINTKALYKSRQIDASTFSRIQELCTNASFERILLPQMSKDPDMQEFINKILEHAISLEDGANPKYITSSSLDAFTALVKSSPWSYEETRKGIILLLQDKIKISQREETKQVYTQTLKLIDQSIPAKPQFFARLSRGLYADRTPSPPSPRSVADRSSSPSPT